jgi:two-component system sensor histidine kinase UhpB
LLSAFKVELAVAERRLAASGAASELLADAQAIADTALHSVRDISHLLHPSLLDDIGLAAAVDWYLQAFSKRHGIKTELVQNGAKSRLRPEVELTAYRIVQEAVTNVARHAHARRVVVTLRADADHLRVLVEDDGRGFDPVAADDPGGRRGLGLIGMRERAALLQGTLQVDSAPGRGTRIGANLPTDARQDTDG